MGGDGGSIPHREELVKNKKRPEQVGRDIENVARWRHCALSQLPLRRPIVACELGRMYNKDAVIEKILDSKKFPNNHAAHIKKLKDVRELDLTPNTALDENTRSGAGNSSVNGDGSYIDMNQADFICPVIAVEMNGRHRFVFLWGCGCVISEKAMRTVEGNKCLKCGKEYAKEDMILLYPTTEEEVAAVQTQMEVRRAQAALTSKKRKAPQQSTSEPGPSKVSKVNGASQPGPSKVSKVNGASQPGPSKVFKLNGASQPGTSKAASSNTKTDAVKGKKVTSSIQSDPNKSKVFKSLFTTSEAAKNQPKNNWVTYNPFYF